MKNKNPLVSIIIPTFNRAHLLGETLDFVAAQTYENWECIVVDDGSSDNTPELMATYIAKDSRFQYHHRPPEHKPGGNGARNYGFKLSKGDFIQWFDSDDLMHPEKLKIKISEAVVNQGDVIIDKHNNKWEKIEKYTPEVIKRKDFYIDFILGYHPVITNDVMLSRKSIGLLCFDENLRKAQEFEFFMRVFEQELKYIFIPLSLTVYEEKSDSISKKSIVLKSESLIYLSKKLIERYSDNSDIIKRAKRQGRKTYKSLIENRKPQLIIKNFNFFRKAHDKNAIVFLAFLMYNYFTLKGFDKIKPK